MPPLSRSGPDMKHTILGGIAAAIILAGCFGDGGPSDAELDAALSQWVTKARSDARAGRSALPAGEIPDRFSDVRKRKCVKQSEQVFDCLVGVKAVFDKPPETSPQDIQIAIAKEPTGWTIRRLVAGR